MPHEQYFVNLYLTWYNFLVMALFTGKGDPDTTNLSDLATGQVRDKLISNV